MIFKILVGAIALFLIAQGPGQAQYIPPIDDTSPVSRGAGTR